MKTNKINKTATLKKVDNLYMVFADFRGEYQEVFQSWDYQAANEYANTWYAKVKNEVTADQGRTLRNYGTESEEGITRYTDYDMAGNKIGEGERRTRTTLERNERLSDGSILHLPSSECRFNSEIFHGTRYIHEHRIGQRYPSGNKVWGQIATLSTICPRDTIALAKAKFGRQGFELSIRTA